MLADIFTAIVLGLTGGITPGPIILIAFAEILRSPKAGLRNGSMYLITAVLTELAMATFLVATASWLEIPEIILHIISLFGITVLLYLAYKVFSIHKIEAGEGPPNIKPYHVVAIMLFNGSIWIYWIAVCLPAALRLGEKLPLGAYLFLVIFEFSMLIGLALIIFGFHYFRKHLKNPQIIRRTFFILGSFILLITLKVAYTEIAYFGNLLLK